MNGNDATRPATLSIQEIVTLRATALDAAIRSTEHGASADAILQRAQTFFGWLAGPAPAVAPSARPPAQTTQQQPVQRQERAPASPPASQNGSYSSRDWGEQHLTEPQRKAIYAIGRGTHNWTDDQTEAACQSFFAGTTLDDLTRKQASAFIDSLKAAAS